MHFVSVAIGGALGAVARYWLSNLIHAVAGREFPWATLSVNIVGSFLMGVLVILIVERWSLSAEWRSVVLVGFLGAFTTFSTFSLETLALIELGEPVRALLYISASVILCVAATWGGASLAKVF